MLRQYADNINNICNLIKHILGVKNSSKITFKMLNDLFDLDMEDSKLVDKVTKAIKNDKKMIMPSVLLLMLQESFEYFVKYEDKYESIKNKLFNNKSMNELADILKEDMWPFYPFFQEALAVFATLHYPELFSGMTDLELVFESSLRELVFVDSEGYVIPITFESFFNQASEFIEDAINKEVLYSVENTSITFHEISNINETLNDEYKIFTYDFLENYTNLTDLAKRRYDAVFNILNDLAIKAISPEINATYKYTKEKINELKFDISIAKNLDILEKINQDVNDLNTYSVTRYNEFADFINNNSIDTIPDSFNNLTDLVSEGSEIGIDNLYSLIDEKIKVLEARFEKKKRMRLVRDLSIKIKNFNEFLIGLKTEIGDMNNISKRQMGNFKSKEEAEFLLNRLRLQKKAYFKNVRVFDYLSMSVDLETHEFKIYKRNDFNQINASILSMEKFLVSVSESILPEKALKEESDFENEGRKVDIKGNQISVALMNEDFSELSFQDDQGHTFNIHDYSAYHKLVDFAVDVRKQPVFQDYGDISEYPYFKPFKYQVDSVRTMLGRFEGRGVFGDQVGLGKTLEALMCADVMFRCATIKNAVIVTTKSTIRQWRNEAMTKFRHEDGSPMFEVYPKHDSYSFRELMKELVKDKEAKNSNALKVYLVSTEQIKSEDTLNFIKESGEYFGLKNAAYNPIPFVPAEEKVIDTDLSTIISLKHLDILKKRLFLELSREIKESLDNNEKYKKITTFNVYGFFTYEFDESSKCFIPTNKELYDEKNPSDSVVLNEIKLLKDYTKKLSLIEERKAYIENELNTLKEKYSYADKRLVDLLIFDEVQDLLYDFSQKGHKEQLLQEFVANIQKKYCILISATPIKNDLNDIFNLLYMVDKNRLGETKEKAENKFYNAYCGGAKSLSEMASSSDAQLRFKKLNGLINSMFTRKRLYDSDVIESIRRHSATLEEINNAKELGRDDYGGQAFMKLIGAIRRSKAMLETGEYESFISKYIRPLFPKYNLSDEIFKDAFLKLSDYVDKSAKICIRRLEYELRMDLIGFNVYDRFMENYRLVLKCEQEGNKDDVYKTAIKTCDLLINYINRGLLAFYRSYQDYSTVFLSDFIDWRRPRKRGERIICDKDLDKIAIFKDLLAVNDKKFERYDLSKNNLIALEAGKILFYEKKSDVRYQIYKNLKEISPEYGNSRRVYMTLSQADESFYNLNDFVHFCYFPKGKKKDEMKALVESLNNKDINELSFDEKRLLDTYTLNGNLMKNEAFEDSFKGLNFKNFTEFSAENENWNSIYFIDKTMLAGTDFNAANILVIGQLDKPDFEYMDPLEMEQLIGRISRMGQTEECIVFTCLYNGKNDSECNREFNEIYYDFLTDEEGFDLYGVCQTEVDFVMPVVMACGKKLFSMEYSYLEKNDIFDKDSSEFKAIYKNGYIEYSGNRFPDLVKYAFLNNDNIDVYYNNEIYKPLDALKEMVRLYSSILRPEMKR
ncbi:MAG: hypothetical protein K6F81_02310 [Acholeplasmatales bacterium]|nr:hypothetical protein [Acholeplasmatales bacterium]